MVDGTASHVSVTTNHFNFKILPVVISVRINRSLGWQFSCEKKLQKCFSFVTFCSCHTPPPPTPLPDTKPVPTGKVAEVIHGGCIVLAISQNQIPETVGTDLGYLPSSEPRCW